MAQRTKKQQGRGRKNRKHGHCLRKPSNQRYKAERRWIKNKARRIARYIRKNPSWYCNNKGNLSQEVRAYLISHGHINSDVTSADSSFHAEARSDGGG